MKTPQKPYILTIDQGTTTTRAILFSKDMDVVAVTQKELELFYPKNGWVEQDAMMIWSDTVQLCQDVVKKAEIDLFDIAAIGITNQRETVVVWDKKTGKPLYNAIVWQDRRTADMCRALAEAGHEEMIREKTGLLIDPYFSATKIKWVLDNVDKARDKAEAGNLLCGTIDAFLIWHLTGGKSHVTDATNASRTQLYNIVEDKWDDELLELFDIPASMLPEVKDNVDDFGTTTHALFGGHDLKITGVAGDQQAAFIGQACFTPGMVKSTYGTGCFALMNIGTDFKSSEHRMLTTIGYRLAGQITYAFEGSIFIAGAAVQWLRDGINIIDQAAESEDMAQDLEHNDDVYLVPAFTGLGAPHWDPEARGIITGITRNTSRSHIVRAALEAQAYQTEDLLEAMAKDAGQPIAELRVDGGMVANNWVCQFLADITGVTVKRPHIIETTALGAGYLAGLGAGLFDSVDDITKAWSEEARFAPQMDQEHRQALYQGWKTALQRCR